MSQGWGLVYVRIYGDNGDGGWEELLELGNERRRVFWSKVGRTMLLRLAASMILSYSFMKPGNSLSK